MGDKSMFMTLDEYVEEFSKSGEKDFYAFMDNKKQEALNSGNNELANHIAEISEQAYKEQLEYDEMMREDYEREQQERRKKEYENYVDDTYYDEYESQEESKSEETSESTQEEYVSENVARYEYILQRIEIAKQRIEELKNEREEMEEWDEQNEIDNQIQDLKFLISDLERDAVDANRAIAREELGTSLTSMAPDEIKSEYARLLAQKKSYLDMVEDGFEIDDEEWFVNQDSLEMIEEYAKTIPELADLVPEQDEEEFEEPSSEEIDAILDKEMKSKQARDAGFEVDEFGEIIRPTKPMAEMSVEELAKVEDGYDRLIADNEEKIRQAYVDRILGKQKTVREQKAILKELESQGIDLDD